MDGESESDVWLGRQWTEVMQEGLGNGTREVFRRVTIEPRATGQSKACSSDCIRLLDLAESDPRVFSVSPTHVRWLIIYLENSSVCSILNLERGPGSWYKKQNKCMLLVSLLWYCSTTLYSNHISRLESTPGVMAGGWWRGCSIPNRHARLRNFWEICRIHLEALKYNRWS